MKIIKYLIVTSLLFISSLVSYEKIEISDNKAIDDTIINENIIEEETVEEVAEEIKEEKPIETTSIDSKESTEKEEKEKQTTTKKDSKRKTKTSIIKKEESKSKTDDKPNEDKPKQEETKTDKPKEDPKPQCSDFYESITHGKVDKSTKSACVSYGNKIQNNELDAVLDFDSSFHLFFIPPNLWNNKKRRCEFIFSDIFSYYTYFTILKLKMEVHLPGEFQVFFRCFSDLFQVIFSLFFVLFCSQGLIL